MNKIVEIKISLGPKFTAEDLEANLYTYSGETGSSRHLVTEYLEDRSKMSLSPLSANVILNSNKKGLLVPVDSGDTDYLLEIKCKNCKGNVEDFIEYRGKLN